MIRRKGNDKWIEIWQSKYKDKDFKPILTKAKDATHDIYTACLAYTNNMIKFKIDSEYEYKAVIKADYRRGASDTGKWVKGEIISGDVKSFVYQAFRVEKDPETIRPYFLPKESVAGYLGGCEVKNFFNSKAVAFNRKKNPVITVSNFASHWTEDGGVRINITDALVDSILHTPAFNAAWAYINDPDNITHAKTEYIKNVILPNIIVNADSTVEIWADMSTDGLSVSDNAGDRWSRVTNVGTKFETEPDGSKTLTFDITERRPYCFIMKLKY